MTTLPPAAPGLISPIFESAPMAARFSDRNLLQAMLDVEAALAAAQAETGIIPATVVESIAQACDATRYDIDEIGAAARLAGNPAIPMVKALTASVEGDAARYVHWGATSQDIIDTALMLLVRGGLAEIRDDVSAAMGALLAMIAAHRETVMVGRTFMQQALPITLAFKAAVWLSGLVAARRSLRRLLAEEVAIQFAGAVGTLASLGGDGLKVRAALARRLGLAEPVIAWHAERSRFAAIAAGLAVFSGSAAKIATDVLLLMQTEVAEAMEPAAPGKGGSSTMPHKRNPVAGAAIRANHHRGVGILTPLLLALEAEHERGAGAWGSEWEPVRDLFLLTGGSAHLLSEMLAGLEIDGQRMAANLGSTGMPMAESLMMALAPSTGRMQAHHLVEQAVKAALADGVSLYDAARCSPEISAQLSESDIAHALEPKNYLGVADAMVDAVVGEAARELEEG